MGKAWVGGYQEGGCWGDVYGFKAEGIYRDWDDVKNSGIKKISQVLITVVVRLLCWVLMNGIN